ncbi:MAG: hypothetical protein MJ198_05645 [Bacteroidales bacterium]|nr:hypothetical protein [Bacteroidales bacterium]
MRDLKFILNFFILILLSQATFSQVNFFTDEETDSLATNFYQRNKQITTMIVGNLPSMQFGTALFIHNAEDKISYYVEAKSDFNRRYVIEGEECNGDGIRQKEVAYKTTSLNVGVARGFTRNWFIYAGAGFVLKNTEFENVVENNYRYNVPNNGVWFNMAAGTMYVFDNNFSALVGLDLYDRSVTIGLGYTW